MLFTTALLGLLATSPALAAPPSPRSAEVVSAMADTPQWTIGSFKRTCNTQDTWCIYSFTLPNIDDAATGFGCTHIVEGTPASRASINGQTCGPYTVSSAWSGQFGEDKGFTTFSIVHYAKRLIVWPAYADWEVKNGTVVVPDKSYAPAVLP
ncbi:hypothetical protein QBC38DRAFT_492362 [Podospora fimiseda]|uniref:Small secreted protein n=1 Tax=Podospora fimiseda TaxID=252190 RepID=A0AAN6YR51_9PEZI|nr:hypothetical protein QBC38DRAFT_492362 [Podospora fimiseda]